MNTIHVAFFAVFREQAGTEAHTLDTAAASASDLFEELRAVFPGLEPYANMKYAINDELARGDRALRDGDRVLFFPPVAGG